MAARRKTPRRKAAHKRKAPPGRKAAKRRAAPRKQAAPRRSVRRALPNDDAWRELVETAVEKPDPDASAVASRRKTK